LQILKAHFGHALIAQTNDVFHPPLLDVILLKLSSSFFITTMQFNCSFAMLPVRDCNLTMYHMQRWMAYSQILKLKKFEFFWLVELVIIMVLGSVEDEKTFFTLIFMKSKLRNWLTTHLKLVVKMYAQSFYLHSIISHSTLLYHWVEWR
jgi:hypothetical protein